jgi:GNAT superfamily N-acetyltransferase
MNPTWRAVRASGAEALSAGQDLVLSVSATTGFPDPNVWPEELLRGHTRARQEPAEQTWLATTDDGRRIGHALVEKVAADSAISSIPGPAAAAEAGVLLELGAVAVHPDWQGRGVAKALVEACAEDLARIYPEVVLVAAVWPDGPSATWAARKWVLVGESVSPKGQAVRIFRRP